MAKTRVLVVEDDDDTRQLIDQELGEAGYEVIPALDGQHALRLANIARPSVLVVDIGLPEMNGDEFVRRWRASSDGREAPVVIVSARKDAPDVAKSLGVATFIAKPFGVEQLVAAVAQCVDPATSGGTTDRAEAH